MRAKRTTKTILGSLGIGATMVAGLLCWPASAYAGPPTEDRCRGLSECAVQGYCSEVRGWCVAATNSDCASSRACRLA